MNRKNAPYRLPALLAAALFGTTLAVATTARAEPASYTVDPAHSSVMSESRHFGTSTVRTRFPVKTGNITIDPAAKTGKGSIYIDVSALATGVPALDTHLKGNDFFDAAGYPEATFVANAFQFDGDKVTQIGGDLTMRGKTAPVTLKANNYNCYLSPVLKKQVCGGEFEGAIQRSQWDVKYGIPFVPDATRIVIEIEASKD